LTHISYARLSSRAKYPNVCPSVGGKHVFVIDTMYEVTMFIANVFSIFVAHHHYHSTIIALVLWISFDSKITCLELDFCDLIKPFDLLGFLKMSSKG
jgi:hypothetical protein